MPTEWGAIKTSYTTSELDAARDAGSKARVVIDSEHISMYDADGNLQNRVELTRDEDGSAHSISHPCDEECFAEVAARAYRQGYAHGKYGVDPKY
jgi:hypothetical protein